MDARFHGAVDRYDKVRFDLALTKFEGCELVAHDMVGWRIHYLYDWGRAGKTEGYYMMTWTSKRCDDDGWEDCNEGKGCLVVSLFMVWLP